MNDATARHGLPLIQPGQAQKELSHNEALAALDLLVQPAVTAIGTDTPPADPATGIAGSSARTRPMRGRDTPTRWRDGLAAAGASLHRYRA